jgi:hypothetical protein
LRRLACAAPEAGEARVGSRCGMTRRAALATRRSRRWLLQDGSEGEDDELLIESGAIFI